MDGSNNGWIQRIQGWPIVAARKTQQLWVTMKLNAMEVFDPDKKAAFRVRKVIRNGQSEVGGFVTHHFTNFVNNHFYYPFFLGMITLELRKT